MHHHFTASLSTTWPPQCLQPIPYWCDTNIAGTHRKSQAGPPLALACEHPTLTHGGLPLGTTCQSCSCLCHQLLALTPEEAKSRAKKRQTALLSNAHQLCPDDVKTVCPGPSNDTVNCSCVLPALTCGCFTLYSTAPCTLSLPTGTMQNNSSHGQYWQAHRAQHQGPQQAMHHVQKTHTCDPARPCTMPGTPGCCTHCYAVRLNSHCMVCRRVEVLACRLTSSA